MGRLQPTPNGGRQLEALASHSGPGTHPQRGFHDLPDEADLLQCIAPICELQTMLQPSLSRSRCDAKMLQ